MKEYELRVRNDILDIDISNKTFLDDMKSLLSKSEELKSRKEKDIEYHIKQQMNDYINFPICGGWTNCYLNELIDKNNEEIVKLLKENIIF